MQERTIRPDPVNPSSPFRVRTFGSLSLESRDGAVPAAVTQRKRLAFLALLATAEPNGMARERLLLLLWPESTMERARGALYQLLYAVRQAFGEGSVTGSDELRFDPAIVSSDVADFQAALARNDLAAAVELHRGPFLDAFHISGAPELERWIDAKRQELARGYQTALSRLTTQATERGDFAAAVGYAERLAAADPLSDRATLQLMEALAASGDVTAAVDRARVHASVVRAELGTDVDPSINALVDRLRRGASSAKPATRLDPPVPVIERALNDAPPKSPSPRTTWAKVPIALIAAGAAVMLATSFALRDKPDRGAEYVIVADVATEPADSSIADVLTETTRRALSTSRSMRAVLPGRLSSARARLRIPDSARLTDSVARQMALGEGLRAVVTGSLKRMGDQYALSMKLIAAVSGEVRASDGRTGITPDKLTFVLDTMARTLRARAGDDLELIRSEPSLLALTSTSLDAMLAYVAALRPNIRRDSVESLLRRAIALDTSFAIALWKLSFVMENTSSVGERRSLVARAYAHREGLTDYERTRVQMAYQFSPDGQTPDRGKLIQLLRQVVDRDPNANDALILADFYRLRRDLAAAESTYRRVIALDSTHFQAHAGLVATLLAAGRISEARKAANSIRPPVRGVRSLEVVLAYAEEGRRKARDVVEAAVASPTAVFFDYLNRAMLNLLEGRLADWERDLHTSDSLVAAEAAARSKANGRVVPPRGPAFPFTGLRAEYWVRHRPDVALRILDSIPATHPAKRSLDVAEFYAQFGQPVKARAIVDSIVLQDKFNKDSRKHSVIGWILLAEGKPIEAIKEFRDSDTLPDGPVMASDIALDPNIGLAFERASLPDSAIAVYEHYLKRSHLNIAEDTWKLAWVLERIAPLYVAQRRPKDARAAYERLVDLWQHADAELQPRVAHARAQVEALAR